MKKATAPAAKKGEGLETHGENAMFAVKNHHSIPQEIAAKKNRADGLGRAVLRNSKRPSAKLGLPLLGRIIV